MANGHLKLQDNGQVTGNLNDLNFFVDFRLQDIPAEEKVEDGQTHIMVAKGSHGHEVQIGTCKEIEIQKQGSAFFGQKMYTRMFFSSDTLPTGRFKAFPQDKTLWRITKDFVRQGQGQGSSGYGQYQQQSQQSIDDEIPF